MKDMKTVTIVMTYLNRKTQLRNTLESINCSNYNNLDILIVDDNSTDGEDIHCFENDYTKVITMKNKTWINPCIPFNVGFKEAKGDVIIIQNAECLHIGNIVGHVLDNIEKNVYLSYAALSINKELTKIFFEGEKLYSLISPHFNDYILEHGGNGWYNHSKYRPEMLHFCCAIMKEDLYELGGFDERYANGLGYDDNDFIWRVQKKKMITKIIDYPFVVHQYHESFNPGDVPTLMAINEPLFIQAKAGSEYDVKKYNRILK